MIGSGSAPGATPAALSRKSGQPGANRLGYRSKPRQAGTATMRRSIITASLAWLMVVAPAGAPRADQHRLQEDFTFKRIGVPPAGATQRITVQIEPPGPASADSPDPAVAPPTRTPGAAAGTAAAKIARFWDAVSPDLADSDPASFVRAETVLATAPEDMAIAPPRLDEMRALAERYGPQILAASVGEPVSPALVLAVIAVESAGNPRAVSHAGAHGVMQLMPATARRFDVRDRFDPEQNIAGGVAYLSWLMGEFERDVVMVLAGYNAGEGAVRDNGGVPPFPETRAYVPRVLAAWRVARGLCATPPELPSDGCVFDLRAGS